MRSKSRRGSVCVISLADEILNVMKDRGAKTPTVRILLEMRRKGYQPKDVHAAAHFLLRAGLLRDEQ